MSKNIYLIGYRAVGKSTLSNIIANKLKKKVIHMDDLLESRIGPFSLFVKKNSWALFRKKESALLRELPKDKTIIDCGGGIILDNKNTELMKKTGIVIWLKANPETIKKRLLKDNKKSQRPRLSSKSAIEEVDEILEKRTPLYKKAADIIIETDGKTKNQVAESIINKLKEKDYIIED